MFDHEQDLKNALEKCSITKLVQDLGNLYSSLVASSNSTNEEFALSLKVNKILSEAAKQIADLGPKPKINGEK